MMILYVDMIHPLPIDSGDDQLNSALITTVDWHWAIGDLYRHPVYGFLQGMLTKCVVTSLCNGPAISHSFCFAKCKITSYMYI